MKENQKNDCDLNAVTIRTEDGNKISSFRLGLPQILAVCVKNMVLLAFGMSLGFPTIVIGGNENEIDLVLSKTQISWFSSINLICVPLGCIFSGTFTSYLGRRRAMQLVNIPIFASWLLFHYATSITHLYLALCLAGAAGGMMEAPVLTYVAEITTPSLRGLLSATGSTCIILGIFSQFVLGTFLKWRTIALISSTVPILAIFLLFFVPESPHWLILKKRFGDAKNSLMWLRGWTKNFDNVRDEYDALYGVLVKPSIPSIESDKPSCGDKLKPYQRRSFLFPYFLCSLSFFIGHFSGMTTLQTFAVQIFATLKAPIDKYYATMILGTLELCGSIICVILVRFVGKRPLAIVSTLGCGICFLLTATYAFYLDAIPGPVVNNVIANVSHIPLTSFSTTTEYYVETTTQLTNNGTDLFDKEFISKMEISWNYINDTEVNFTNLTESKNPLKDDEDEDMQNEYSWIPLTLLLGSAILSHCGIRLLPWILVGEVFPGEVRSVASGLSGGLGYIFGFLANKLFLTMIETLTLPGTFWFYSGVSIVGCLILYLILPETEGRTLIEIEAHFNGTKKLPKSMPTKQQRTTPVLVNAIKDFDVTKWESNEKFEKHLQQRKISQMANIITDHHKNLQQHDMAIAPCSHHRSHKKSKTNKHRSTQPSHGGFDNAAYDTSNGTYNTKL